MASHGEGFRKNAWHLHPRLEVPDLFPPAVLFSLFDFDPRPKFRESLKRVSGIDRESMADGSAPLDPALTRQLRVTAAWDRVFREVTGDRVAMVSRDPQANEPGDLKGKLRNEVIPAYAVLIGSTEPAGTKWLASRATRYHEHVVAWCLPINVAAGKVTEIALTPENMIALDEEHGTG